MSALDVDYIFLPRDAMHRAAYAVVRCLYVRPSVGLSRSCVVSKRFNVFSNFFTFWYIHHSSFSIPNVMEIFRRETLNGDRMQVLYEKNRSRFSSNISLYFDNDTKQGRMERK